jgi:hypothetical protein
MPATVTHRQADGHLPDPASGPAFRAPVHDSMLALDGADLDPATRHVGTPAEFHTAYRMYVGGE